MKNLSEKLNEETQQLNESFIGSFDLSLAVIISTVLSSLISIGITVTGQVVKGYISSTAHERNRPGRNKALMELKDLTRSLPAVTDPIALKILNNPGAWSSAEIEELRHSLYNMMDDDEQKKFDELEDEYLNQQKKVYRFR